jgi:hypothetical protein
VRIREVVHSTGNIFTVAGTGVFASSGDGTAATSASVQPSGVYLDAQGNIFIPDSINQRVREVVAGTPAANGTTTGIISTVAGGAPFPVTCAGQTDQIGDGCVATSARLGAARGVFVDSAGNIVITDFATVRKVAAASQIITVVAGSGAFSSFSGDGFSAVDGQLNTPGNIFVDASGNLFIADMRNNRIREVFGPNPPLGQTAGNMVTVAGGGANPSTCTNTLDMVGDGCLATEATLSQPAAVFVDGSGNIFIADSQNHLVREVFGPSSNTGTSGTIGRVAGVLNQPGFNGDNQLATAAHLSQPTGVFVDNAGNIFIADSDPNGNNNSRIREIFGPNSTMGTPGNIRTVAGTGQSASNGDGGSAISAAVEPQSVVVDSSGNIFFSEPNSSKIREVFGPTPPAGQIAGAITTVAGSTTGNFNGDDIPATTAQLNFAQGIALDSAGNLFIADTNNGRVQEVFAANSIIGTPGNIVTVAGDFAAAFAGDGGPPTKGALNQPSGVFVDAAGDIFIADTANLRIREVAVPAIQFNPTSLTFASTVSPQVVGTASAAQSVTIGNPGHATLTISDIAISGASTGDYTQTNNCSSSLAPNGSCTVSITFAPTHAGTRTASLKVTDNATGNSQLVGLSGEGALSPVANVSPAGIQFVSQPTGTTSGPQTVTLSNTGSATLSISSIGITGTNAGDFTQTNTCGPTPTTLAAGTNCAISVTFTPTAAAGRSATLTVTDDAPGNPHAVGLLGTGSSTPSPVVSLSPASVLFANQPVGSTSGTQTITLTNTGNAALMIANIAVSGANSADFVVQSNNCSGSIAANLGCTISVTFTPAVAGTRSASIAITDNATGSPQSAPLTGTGTTAPNAGLNPGSVTFASQPVGTTSGAQAITLSNTGNAPLAINNIAVTGANNGDFAQTNNCGASLAAASSCAINVTFAPAASGVRSAAVTVTDNSSNSAQSAILIGTGGATAAPVASVTPSFVLFASQAVGSASAAQAVTLTNTGNAALTISGLAVSGTNSAEFAQTNNCAASIAANGSCTINVTFTPAAAGTRSASLAISDNAAGSPHAIALSGTGAAADFTLGGGQGGTTTSTVTAGQTANYMLQLSATGAAQTVSLTCIGAPVNATCTVPATMNVTPGTPATVNVSVITASRSVLAPLTAPRGTKPPFVWFVILALLGALWTFSLRVSKQNGLLARLLPQVRPITAIAAIVLLASAALFSGCTGAGSAPTTPPPVAHGTPAGTSTLVITATTANGVSHFTEITLTVQ